MSKKNIETYEHEGETRVNNPPVGLVTPETDPDADVQGYSYDPHLDPSLSWAGKSEHTSFEVATVSLHVHERIDPRTIINSVRKQNRGPQQTSLFDCPEENPPIRQAIDFYKHRHNWTNRLIAGDSLLVMNSLLEKEGLGGQVQTIYIDPPYGIRYGSNFQPFINKSEVIDKDDNLTTEPEQIRAFRDTWELGIHSYLTYLRDRLLLARELLSETGSCFVQIGKANVHLVGLLLDEVFGTENRMATITFVPTGTSSTNFLPEVAHFLIWYAKDKKNVKYRQLYKQLTRQQIVEHFSYHAFVELPDGTCRTLTSEESFNPDLLPPESRIFQRTSLTSQGASSTGRSEPYIWNDRVFNCPDGRQWSISKEGIDHLVSRGRLFATEEQQSLTWKKYEDELPGRKLNNVWSEKILAQKKRYVVETGTKPIQRAILMTSDPGDLILDPTCGSGTTAFVAEQWGRRWITCDTSRVAISIAKQRLMTACFDYYELAHSSEGVGGGFSYRSVSKVSPKSLAYDHPPEETYLYDNPKVDQTKARVTGPFTVEAVPAPIVKSIDEAIEDEPVTAHASVARTGETIRHEDWRDELFKTGIRGKAGQHLWFSRLEPLPGVRSLHADGEIRPQTSESNNDISCGGGGAL